MCSRQPGSTTVRLVFYMRPHFTGLLFLLLFGLISRPSLALSPHYLDSLEKVLPSETGADRLSTLICLSKFCGEKGAADKAIAYAQEAVELAQKEGNPKKLGDALLSEGFAFKKKNEKDKAIEKYLQAYSAWEKTGDRVGMSAVLNNIGTIYREMRNPAMSLKYMESALKIRKEIGDPLLIAMSLNGIGSYYYDLNEFEKGIECFQAAKLIFQKANDRRMIAQMENSLGAVYSGMKDYAHSNENLEHALHYYEEVGDTAGIALCLSNIGNNYNLLGNAKKGVECAQRAIVFARKKFDTEVLPSALEFLCEGYQQLGDYKRASEYQSQLLNLKDSLYDLQSNQNIAEMQTRFETDKKEKQNEILRQTVQIQELAGTRQRLILYSVSGLGILLLTLAFYMLRGYRLKQKANRILTMQKTQIEMKNSELKKAYTEIEEKNKDITDSIKYALRIQNAILPPEQMVKHALPDSFILYKPKDIISGDFFWVEQWGNQVLFAAVDCTGHGVPGALMSIVGYNLLNQALHEHGLSKPNLILNSLNKGLSSTLRQKEDESSVKDGMDIALCSWDKQKNKLEFAAAYNSLWLIRNGTLTEYKGDKFPVGAFLGEQLKNFSCHTIELQQGDNIYIFSDGYADQFGGPKGKKFKYKQMEEELLAIQDQSMTDQCIHLERKFISWKGELGQVDDILVMGVRI
jgi:serine phosphatase RsbU (regulator of sigma subunit)